MTGLVLDGPRARLLLEISGDQFPGERGIDGGWLIVSGRGELDGRSWRFREPCLLDGEVGLLIDWLRAAADGRELPGGRRIEFVEPNLAFEIERPDPATVRIRVLLLLAVAPPWWDSYGGAADALVPFELPIEIGGDELARATNEFADGVADVLARGSSRGSIA